MKTVLALMIVSVLAAEIIFGLRSMRNVETATVVPVSIKNTYRLTDCNEAGAIQLENALRSVQIGPVVIDGSTERRRVGVNKLQWSAANAIVARLASRHPADFINVATSPNELTSYEDDQRRVARKAR